MKELWAKIEKRLSSINLTLILLLLMIPVLRGGEVPCVDVLKAAGMEMLFVPQPEAPEVGPPEPKQVSILLRDGQWVTVMENGTIRVEGGN